MNNITSMAAKLMELPSLAVAGTAIGSSIGKAASDYLIGKGQEVYLKHRSLDCARPTLQKIAGIALMGFSLLSSLVLSAIGGLATAIGVASACSSFGPKGIALGITAGLIFTGLQTAASIHAFVKAVKGISQPPVEENDEDSDMNSAIKNLKDQPCFPENQETRT